MCHNAGVQLFAVLGSSALSQMGAQEGGIKAVSAPMKPKNAQVILGYSFIVCVCVYIYTYARVYIYIDSAQRYMYT